MEVGSDLGKVYKGGAGILAPESKAIGQLNQLAVEDRRNKAAQKAQSDKDKAAQMKRVREFNMNNKTNFAQKLQENAQTEVFEYVKTRMDEGGNIDPKDFPEIERRMNNMAAKSDFFTGYAADVGKMMDLVNKNPDDYDPTTVSEIIAMSHPDNYDKIWENQGVGLPTLKLKDPEISIQDHLTTLVSGVENSGELQDLTTVALSDPNNEQMRLDVMAAYKQLYPDGGKFRDEQDWFASIAQAYIKPEVEKPYDGIAGLKNFKGYIDSLSHPIETSEGKIFTSVDDDAIARNVEAYRLSAPQLAERYSKDEMIRIATDFNKNKFKTGGKDTTESKTKQKEKETKNSSILFASNLMSGDNYNIRHAFNTMLFKEDASMVSQSYKGWEMREVSYDDESGTLSIEVRKPTKAAADELAIGGEEPLTDDQFTYDTIPLNLKSVGARKALERTYFEANNKKGFNYDFTKNPYLEHLSNDPDIKLINDLLE